MLPMRDEVEVRQRWRSEWSCFPPWPIVLRTAAAFEGWVSMTWDERRSACEVVLLRGEGALDNLRLPERDSLATYQALSSTSHFLNMSWLVGTFVDAHGLDRRSLRTSEVVALLIKPACRAFGMSYATLFFVAMRGQPSRPVYENACLTKQASIGI